MEEPGRRGRRRKQLLDNLKETKKYWLSKEEAPDHSLWRTHFGRQFGRVVTQTARRRLASITLTIN